MPPNFLKLFWDQSKAGVDRARLTPWTIESHQSIIDAKLAAVEVTEGKEAAEVIRAAYKANEEAFCKANKCDCKTVVEPVIEEKEEIEDIEEEVKEIIEELEEEEKEEIKQKVKTKTSKKSSPKE